MGITGSDLIQESGAEVDVRLNLGVGRCRLALLSLTTVRSIRPQD